MVAYASVLIGTDGSEPAQVALDVGGAIAARLGIPVTVIGVAKAGQSGSESGGLEWAQEVTQAAAGALRAKGVAQVSTIEREGAPGDVILEIAGENPDALLVMGARGLGSPASRIAGSTSNHVSHHTPIDVLFAHEKPAQWGAVGLATDGSATSKIAVRKGLAVAQALGSAVFLVTAAKDEESGERVLAQVESELATEHAGLEFEHHVLTGVGAADALIDASWKYDLMVIGNRGMSGIARVLGSTANSVTHNGKANLLMVNTGR